MRSADKKAQTLTVALCALAATSMMAGCRASDALKEIVYRQDSEIVDYDNPAKFYINDSSAEETSDKVSSAETSDDAAASEEEQNLVVYGSQPNAEGFTAKRSLFSKYPDFLGIEASEGIAPYYSTDPDAIEYEVPEVEETEEDQEDDDQQVVAGTNATKSGEEGESSESDISGDKGIAKGEQGDNGGGTSTDDEDDEEDPVSIVDATDEFADPPSVDRIAAYGELAVIVQMVGGESALAAADEELLGGKFSTVFNDEGAADITRGWEDDGATAEGMDVDAIVNSEADTILAFSSDYLDTLTAKERKKLNKAGVTLTVMPALTCSGNIKQAVSTVATMLEEAEDIGQAGFTQEIASDYRAFHDDVVSACIKSAGGKLAGDSVYQSSSDDDLTSSTSSAGTYTLLVDGFATNASYKGSFKTWTPNVSDGVALATVGWTSTPISFYIQAAGIVNNACADSTKKMTGKMVVWPFRYNQLSFDESEWSSGSFNGESMYWPNNPNGWTKSLLTVSSAFAADSISAGNALYGASFGTDTFPNIIVTSEDYKNAILKSSKRSSGLYHPYEYQTAKISSMSYSFFGVYETGWSSPLYACIGANGDTATENVYDVDGGIEEEDILINPVGLFTSWTEGSVESFLESAWVNDEVNAETGTISVDGCNGYEECVEYFYQTFYRYDKFSSSDLKSIEAGE